MTYRHIMVTIDGSDTALAAVRHAVILAKAFACPVTAVSVLTPEPVLGAEFMTTDALESSLPKALYQKALHDLQIAEQLFLAEHVPIRTHISEGVSIHEEIVQLASELDADVIVMGSHGRTGLKKLVLGSVTQNVLGIATVPVLVVRGDEH